MNRQWQTLKLAISYRESSLREKANRLKTKEADTACRLIARADELKMLLWIINRLEEEVICDYSKKLVSHLMI